jgi:hypothetical protein
VTTEYTITRNRVGRYYVAVDGRFSPVDFASADDARAWVQAHARSTQQRDAGITEVFGRNVQLVQGARGGWRRWHS